MCPEIGGFLDMSLIDMKFIVIKAKQLEAAIIANNVAHAEGI